MLHTLTALERMSIEASDGRLGTVKDTYFDDQAWTLRYLVIDTAKWLPGRKVLISPLSVQAIDWQQRTLSLQLTREQIQRSPSIDADRPVTRQHEIAHLDHFGYPYYWSGPLRWGAVPFPPSLGGSAPADGATRHPDYWWEQQRRTMDRQGDPHLRSTEEVTGYHIEADDGEIGHVQDFLFDEQDWSLRFLAIDTRNWWPGRHVLVGIDWIERVNWRQRTVHLSMSREAIRQAPEWQPDLALVAREEDFLHDQGSQAGDRRPSEHPSSR